MFCSVSENLCGKSTLVMNVFMPEKQSYFRLIFFSLFINTHEVANA